MSEITGYLLIYCNDAEVTTEMQNEFAKDNNITVKDEDYIVTNIAADQILDIEINSSEYYEPKNLSAYIKKKYKPQILLSSFEEKAYVDNRKVARKKAIERLNEVSAEVQFALLIQTNKYQEAIKLLKSNPGLLSKSIFNVPNCDRCFFGTNAELMQYAIENGYHDHICTHHEYRTRGEYREHVLHRMIYGSDLNLIKYSLEKGANVNEVDDETETLLHKLAVIYFSGEVDFDGDEFLELLLKYSADLNATNWEGFTPLMKLAYDVDSYDVESEDEETLLKLVKKLVENGADINIFDTTGAGLLIYFNDMPKVKTYLLSVDPNLKPHTDDFDFHPYVMKRAYLSEDKLPRRYSDYFITCIELSLIDFMLTEHNLNLISELTLEKQYILHTAIIESEHVVKILTAFRKHDIPISVQFSAGSYEGIQNCQSIDVAKLNNNEQLVEFYQQHKNYKQIIRASEITLPENKYVLKQVTPD